MPTTMTAGGKLPPLLLVILPVWVCLLQWHQQPVSCRILSQCDAAKALVRAGVPRTFVSSYVCVMKHESGFDTTKLVGPGHKASYKYGVFQIGSDKWCNAFRPGGTCNQNCQDFLKDDIQSDIGCARVIVEKEGFQHWGSWRTKCDSGKNLPNVLGCVISKRNVQQILIRNTTELY